MGCSHEIRWVACRSFPLIWREWDDDEAIVFHSGSGDTHLLNAVSASILRLLEDHPLTIAQIASQTAALFGTSADGEYSARVAALLTDFDELGLVESVA